MLLNDDQLRQKLREIQERIDHMEKTNSPNTDLLELLCDQEWAIQVELFARE